MKHHMEIRSNLCLSVKVPKCLHTHNERVGEMERGGEGGERGGEGCL